MICYEWAQTIVNILEKVNINMATWTLKTQHKKNAVEKQHWYKDGKEIIRQEGYRWGTFYCESDEKPDMDLENADDIEIGQDEYRGEL